MDMPKRQVISPEAITLRTEIRPGDIGYLIYMHGRLYAKEQGYRLAFEGYVAKSFYEFITAYDPDRDCLWLAEYDGEIVGSIGIVGRGERAQLRWFLLRPDCRGIGLGGRLLREALAYAKGRGFASIYLETTSDLPAAIAMYEKAGFVKVAEQENHLWADDIHELTYAMNL